MPEEIISRILRLPGYGGYAWEAEETTNTLTLWVRQTAAEASYVCSGCGISVRDVHSWTERRVRDLPWGTWQVWLVVEVHRVRCRRCGVRAVRSLTRMGRLVTCGGTSGYEVTTNVAHIFHKQLTLLGSNHGTKRELGTLVKLLEAGRLRPVVDRVLPLREAREAHRLLEERKAFGKVVLVPEH